MDGEVVTVLSPVRPNPDHRWLMPVAAIRVLRDGMRWSDHPIPCVPSRYPRAPWWITRLAENIGPVYSMPDDPFAGDRYWGGSWWNPAFGGWSRDDVLAVERAIEESFVLYWQEPERFRYAQTEVKRWVAEHVDEAVRRVLCIRSDSPTGP